MMDGTLSANETIPDEELVRQAKAGELEAFEALVNRYERAVYNLARRIVEDPTDAEDVTQETFLNVLENLERFREEASFRTWLFRIATHAAFKVLRERSRKPTVSLEAMLEASEDEEQVPRPEFIADWRDDPQRLLEQQETRRILEEALHQLDEKYRLVFLLRDVEGLSVRETAEVLGLTESNVKVRLLRARLQLRESLTRAFGDEARRLEPSVDHEHDFLQGGRRTGGNKGECNRWEGQ
jgi:RNA polymerase sigma-70 factor (ECF subfamily)